jgi:hypothetical protein
VEASFVVPAHGDVVGFASCPPGTLVLGGAFRTDVPFAIGGDGPTTVPVCA